MKRTEELKQVFIKCGDNDYWFYYLHVLKSLFDYYDYYPQARFNPELMEIYIRKQLDNLMSLVEDYDKGFPWHDRLTVYFNEEAVAALEKYRLEYGGNSECAYMDIETYLITPGATIDKFIFNV